MNFYDLIVIGGGPAGCMASIQAGQRNLNVLLLEGNEKIGKKLYITGKGRCNLTNNSSCQNHLDNIINGKQFMNSASRAFTAKDTIEFFENRGIKLKTERGNRVFPESDKSSDIIKILEKSLKDNNVKIEFNSRVISVNKKNDFFYIKCDNNNEYTSRSVIIATGGCSYSATGSNGFGLKIAKQFGHNIIEPKGALVPIILNDDVKALEGLSLINVTASVSINDKIVGKEFGEMLFTDVGVSGPIILTLSSKINRFDLKNVKLYIDFKPVLDEKKLDEKLIREINDNSSKSLSNYLKTLLPMSFVPYFLQKLGCGELKLHQINKELRKSILTLLKRFDFSIKTLDNINKAIVTSGGVSLKEISPKTMESKLIKNLFFVGEVLDIDALTGGYNLQIAFSTGYVAGNSVNLE